jgi:hypothetical protein
VKSKVRWVPARASLGQNQFITEVLRAPAEPATSVPAAATVPAPAAAFQVGPGDTKTVTNGLLYGGVILAGLGLAWLLTRKS